MGLRHRSIRLRVFLLVIIPILSLTGLYAFVASITVGNAIGLARAKTVKNVIATPTSDLQVELNTERGLALIYLARPTSGLLTHLLAQEIKTNQARKLFEDTVATSAITNNATPQEKRTISAMVEGTSRLASLRAEVVQQSISQPAALTAYSKMAATGFQLLDQTIEQQTSVPLVTQALAVVKLDEADQTVQEESNLLVSGLTAGSFPAADRQEFTELAAVRRSLLAQALPEFTPAYQAYYQAGVSAQAASSLTALENKVISSKASAAVPPVSVIAWDATATTYVRGLGKALVRATNTLTAGAQAQSRHIYLQLILAGGLGLLAILVSILFSVLIGRGLIRPLAALRQAALDLANDRLPDVIERLRAGEDVDVSAEVPPLESSADEIGQVRQAFNAVQRTAIEAAVDEARLRRGISDVFRNLARRSQSLLHRQLALLDSMERRASGPEELEDLFRIDHLTTRMRRHAEGLIILSGESPGRGWRHPVPLVDVLRAAVAEVEDYTRIRVVTRTQAALAGPAVADVIHLIAELAENATIYSPPNTPVRILGDVVGRGFAVEIEDRGLGISDGKLTEINTNFASPPQFDLSGSDRLGLFIAGRLARRHDIKITLRPSPYGGTTAIVLIPSELVVSDEIAGAGDPHQLASAGDPPQLATGGPQQPARAGGPRQPARAGDPQQLARAERERAILLSGRHAVLSQADTFDPLRLPDPPALAPTSQLSAADSTAAAIPTAIPTARLSAADASADGPLAPARSFDLTGGPAQQDHGTPAADPRISTTDPARPGLPTRIRQANLAPQLRGNSTPSPASNADDAAPATLSPQAARLSAADASADGPLTPARSFDLTGAPAQQDHGTPAADPRISTTDPARPGLPTRIRQANLAPQLRGNSTPSPASNADEAAPATLSPEAARNTMAALQKGWERGRSASGTPRPDVPPAPPPDPAAGELAPDGADE
jgi:signal transduction histidine kinase